MNDLLEKGQARVDWIRSRMQLLRNVQETFKREQPFSNKTIGVSLHLEPKTAVLLETLKVGGARIVGTGNLGSTQDDIVEVLKSWGMTIYGERSTDKEEHFRNIAKTVSVKPDLLLDNGADLVECALKNNLTSYILGGTEETTSGDDKLRAKFINKINFPIIVINDSPLKKIVENQHAVGQGNVESIMRMTNLMINGRRFVIVGYGWCGRGMAHYIKSFGGRVSIVEIDPVKNLEAVMDGFRVDTMKNLASWGQFFCTATSRESVISVEEFNRMPDGSILANSGHFPDEINVNALRELAVNVNSIGSDLEEFELPNGKKLILLAGGQMIELAGTEPKGNSIEAMDLGFMLQALSLELLAKDSQILSNGPQSVPTAINHKVAELMVESFK
ncbi:adenosylhomocysteinase [Paracoccaceae bacterium]|nr:adenosylhomocysteinase [Paracoccaceae bacterium]|tara:strand:+ start:272 stop:1438 length:1167 start_codon:yes stop_codon:yes gene_type:complete